MARPSKTPAASHRTARAGAVANHTTTIHELFQQESLAEKGRMVAEARRVAAEEDRIAAEEMRRTAENSRAFAEQLRRTADAVRRQEDVTGPVNDCASDASEALLAKEMLPEELPAAGGVNVTV